MAKYYFRLPSLQELTPPQQSAMDETRPIALSGGPGTGKSVVSILRHIRRHINNKNTLLLTYTTTLARYLRECCAIHNPTAASNVKTSMKTLWENSFDVKNIIAGHWEEIIIDEAQDLPIAYYQRIKPFTKVSYGADDSQSLYPDKGSKTSELRELFDANADYPLDRNFRNTQRVMRFAKTVFPDASIDPNIIPNLGKNVGEMPRFLITNHVGRDVTNPKQNNAVMEIINTFKTIDHNIAILVPWGKTHVPVFVEVLRQNGFVEDIDFSFYYEDSVIFPNGCPTIQNIHITTFKSSKGLEFHTVIIPNFDICKKVLNNQLDKKHNVEWQDYYVAVTRARNNLYLISSFDIPDFNNVTEKQVL